MQSELQYLLLFSLAATAATAQPLSFGVKGGVPVLDFIDTSPGFFSSQSVTNRYLVGPTVEANLPFGLGIEIDAIYRHFRYTTVGGRVNIFESTRSVGNAWEFPLLAKYRFHRRFVRPYVDAGFAWDWVSGRETGTSIVEPVISPGPPVITPVNTSLFANHPVITGFVMGGGLDVKTGVVHFSPEIRYTRWFGQHYTQSDSEFGTLLSRQNQLEVMVGITFGKHD